MAGSSVGNLFVSLGFEVDSKALEMFDKGIKGLSSNMLELLGVSGITAYGVNRFVTGAMSGAQTMQNLAQGTRIATAELQKYSSVINYLNPNISAMSAAGAISDLDRKLNALRQGFGDPNVSGGFGRAGVEIGNKTGIEAINALRKALQGKDTTFQSNILDSIGLPREFLNYFSAKDDQIKYAESKVELSAKQLDTLAESSRRLNQLFIDLTTVLERLLADKLIPFLEALGVKSEDMKKIKDDIEDNKKTLAAHGITTTDRPIPETWWGKLALGMTSNQFSQSYNGGENDLTGIIGGKSNNPGNMEFHKHIVNYDTLLQGYLADAGQLIRYQKRGLNTIDKIVNTWAPYKDENGKVINPATGLGNYQNYLAKMLHVNRGDKLDFEKNPALLNSFIRAQSQFEHGAQAGTYKTSNNVTIYNHGEVNPSTWATYTMQNHQNTINQMNNAAVA